MGKRIPLTERFWRKIHERGDCWIWIGAVDKASGYGRVQVDHSTKYAHRIAYELMVGDIPDGLQLDHLCRTRACVNPYHLDPVTVAENTRRSPITNGSKTHCPSGHAYEGDNLSVNGGRRSCRMCQGLRNAARPKASSTSSRDLTPPAACPGGSSCRR